ncbi:hypothetical protein [Paraburkholderia sp. JHI869]|uniref:hypothetical protein n=1 Tax=Paraburkholderia sp. JHI869 TaxID=3112959 RepID=UPI0031802308
MRTNAIENYLDNGVSSPLLPAVRKHMEGGGAPARVGKTGNMTAQLEHGHADDVHAD